MSLFEQFKELVPDNAVLCSEAVSEVLDPLTEEEIKSSFSALFDQLGDLIYKNYLHYEEVSGQKITDELIKKTGTVSFQDMKSLHMSISQSRKSRAGRAFEFMISEMFKRLNYPFAEQELVGGATPDFLMPSLEYFEKNPLSCIIFTAKRTLRERWRQIVTEANEGYAFFLATIDDKISQNQLNEAMKHKIYIVVPLSLIERFEEYQKAPNVISFEDFFEDYLDPRRKTMGKVITAPILIKSN